jgi:hypothetical protein
MEPFPFLLIVLGLGVAAFLIGAWALSGVTAARNAKAKSRLKQPSEEVARHVQTQ